MKKFPMNVSTHREMFLSEAKDNLQLLNQTLLKLEKTPSDTKSINEIFRAAHTLKGMAFTMNYQELGKLCHAIEDALDKLKKKEISLTPAIVDTLFECFDNIALSLRKISNEEKEADVNTSLSKLDSTLGTASSKETLTRIPEGTETAEEPSPVEKIREVKVKVETLDTLTGLVEELLVNKMVLDQLYASRKLEDMSTALDGLGRLVSDLQYNVMQARLVPVEIVFNRFPRMIRDLAKKEQKQVSLAIEGADIELDRKIVDKLAEPLVHLLRNAIDHGIEGPNEREEQGKPSQGTIKLTARREKEHAVVEVEDDGRGIDVEKVRKLAIDKGLLGKQEAQHLSQEDVLALLLSGGLSTAKTVTEVSGRGIGLDAVKQAVESIAGTVRLTTREGKGSKATMAFPLTLAVVAALLVKVGEETYAIPLADIVRTIKVKVKDTRRALGRTILTLQEDNVPLVQLQEFFGLPQSGKQEVLVVIVRRGMEYLGLGVDSIFDELDIVVKPLSRLVRQSNIFSGFTILGDGTPAMIFDVNGLFDSAAVPQRNVNMKQVSAT